MLDARSTPRRMPVILSSYSRTSSLPHLSLAPNIMVTSVPLVLDHVLNPDHDVLSHSAIYSGSEGNVFCVSCAFERYQRAPNFRRLALLDGVRSILSACDPGSSLRNRGIDACLPMLLQGIDSADAAVVQAATDIMLAVKKDIDNPLRTIASLVSSTVALGLPRGSGHLYLVGQLLADASDDRVLSNTLGNACFGCRPDDHTRRQELSIRDRKFGESVSTGSGGGIVAGSSMEEESFRGFALFLEAHALAASCPDHVKSDVLYVAMEILDCCKTVSLGACLVPQVASLPPPGSDPFVSMMLSIPQILARRSSCDEPLQLHSIAYLATATSYCYQRSEMGVSGWLSNPAGVPDVLITLFNDSHEVAPPKMAAVGGGGGSVQPSSGGLCGTLKALLMSLSYRVRSATARLMASLCNDHRLAGEPESATAHDATSGCDRNKLGVFFRETLIAASVTDFLLDAIKSEREGTPRCYLEAVDALAMSPVEFFHAQNFSIKLASPILLDVLRRGSADGSSSCEKASYSEGSNISDGDDEAAVFALSSRLLLQALVTVTSPGLVVEDLLAMAAISTQPGTPNKTRAIGLAADALSLVASGDISVSKDRRSFIDAVEMLLDRMKEEVACAVLSESRMTCASTSSEGASSPIGSVNQLTAGVWPRPIERGNDYVLVLQSARIYESLLHTAQEWISQQGKTQGGLSFQTVPRGCHRTDGFALADLVFGAYEDTLSYLCKLITRSDSLARDIAFLSCMGAAIDVSSAVLFHTRRRESAAASQRNITSFNIGSVDDIQSSRVRSTGRGATSCDGDPSGLSIGSGEGSEGVIDVVKDLSCDEAGTSTSCLDTILRVAVDADIVCWMLEVYVRCGGDTSGGTTKTRSSQPMGGSPDGDDACGASTRELVVEILQSFLHAQGLVNGLFAYEGNHRSSEEGDGGGMTSDALNSTFGESVRSVMQSWTKSLLGGNEGGVSSPLDQYTLSLLGTVADNGDLCKITALLISLSPSFLGVLHPHMACRVDSAVMILRYVKTLPEAVFCLNLFSHIVLKGNDPTKRASEQRLSDLSAELSTAVRDVLARFQIEDLAVAVIPLSTTALLFSILAGCEEFLADWLVAAPFARIEHALRVFGAFRREQSAAHHDAGDPAATEWIERTALTGVLGGTLSRWGAEMRDDLQNHQHSDAVVHRMVCVLLLSPDTFLNLAFDLENHCNGSVDGDQRGRQGLADSLCLIIPETLEILSAAMSPVVSRQGHRSSRNMRTSELVFTSQVSQLALALLSARSRQGCYTPVSTELHAQNGSSSLHKLPEVPLAHACVGILQGILGRRLGLGSGGRGDDRHKALLAVLNLLNALLVLAGGASELLRQAKEKLTLVLEECHTIFEEVLVPTSEAIESLTNWLFHAPDTLASFLQVCCIWNVIGLTGKSFRKDPSRSFLHVPSQILEKILSLGNSGWSSTVGEKANAPASIRAVRQSLLQVLAARCVESVARRRLFSRHEVRALQLALQTVACDSSATLASEAHGALHALWEAYAGDMQSVDLVGQSWNRFMIECSLESILRSFSRDPEHGFTLLNSMRDIEDLIVDPNVLISTTARLLRFSSSMTSPRLSTSDSSDGGGSARMLSAQALVSIFECATLLALEVRAALGGSLDWREPLQQKARRTSDDVCSFREKRLDEEKQRGGRKHHLLEALAQIVSVLLSCEPLPWQTPFAGEDLRKNLVDALLALHSCLDGDGMSFSEAGTCLKQVSMPLSSGSYYACPAKCRTFSRYEGVFFVKYDSWRSISTDSKPLSVVELAQQVERLIDRCR